MPQIRTALHGMAKHGSASATNKGEPAQTAQTENLARLFLNRELVTTT